MEFASRFPLVLQKDGKNISRYPSNGRWSNLQYNEDFDIWPWASFDWSQNIFTQINGLLFVIDSSEWRTHWRKS